MSKGRNLGKRPCGPQGTRVKPKGWKGGNNEREKKKGHVLKSILENEKRQRGLNGWETLKQRRGLPNYLRKGG